MQVLKAPDSFSSLKELVEMKSDPEAGVHSPERRVSKNERLIAMRLSKRGGSSSRSIKQLFVDNQAGMSLSFPINSSIALLYECSF